MTHARRLALVIALVFALGAGSAVSRADESTTGAPAAEAWYATGLGTVLAATYPAGTLHVGFTAGQETDRTYLRFDLSSLPARAELDGVVVTVPFAADAGTSSPETASVLACAVPGGFDDGGGDTPPEVECDGAPAASVDTEALTVDVTQLVRGDAVDFALVPAGGDTWHLGFDGRERQGGTPPSAVATYEVPSSSTTTTTRPAGATATTLPTPPPSTEFTITPPPVALGSAIAEEVTPPVGTVSVPVTTSTGGGRGFLYPAVFALPMVMVVAIALVGDGLLRPVQLREETV